MTAAKLKRLEADELAIMTALDEAYQRGEIEYLYYGPARDVTAARAAALSFAVRDILKQSEPSNG